MSGDPVYISEGTTFQLDAWDNSHQGFFSKGIKCPRSGYYYLVEETGEEQHGSRLVLRNNPAIQPTENPKDAIGRLKPNLHLVPSGGLIPLARVMELGAEKYGPFNWRDTPIKGSVYVSAAMRHILQWMDGADQDAESGQSHLAHAAACMMIALDAIACGNLTDDRPTPGRAGELCNVNR